MLPLQPPAGGRVSRRLGALLLLSSTVLFVRTQPICEPGTGRYNQEVFGEAATDGSVEVVR